MDTFDVPGAYLHEYMPNYNRILINLRGYFVDIVCQVNPEYEQHVGYKNGETFLYLLVFRRAPFSCGNLVSCLDK